MLLSLALQMLRFKRFMSEYDPHFIEQLKTLYDEPPPAALDVIELSEA